MTSPNELASDRTLVVCHVGDQAGGEDHEQHADDREEPGHREPVPEPVDHEGDGQRPGQPDRGPGHRGRGGGGEDDGQGEDHSLQALAPDRLERQQPQPPPGPPVERRVRARPKLLGQVPGVVAHPERHVGQDRRRHQEGAGLEDRLHPGAVVAADRLVGHHAAGPGQEQRRANADEDVAEVIAAADAVEVGQQDRDDHAGLDALPQEDDERS
jgi:hypothetical protein